MAASLNKVLLIGNLTRDPELRYIPSGTAVASFTIAVNRVYVSASGERKEEATFLPVVVWGRRAEVCGEYLSKGSPVFIEGRIRSRSWESREGQKRTTTEVIASNVQFLRGASKQAASPGEKAPRETPEELESINLNEEGMGSPPSAPPQEGKPSDEEVPF